MAQVYVQKSMLGLPDPILVLAHYIDPPPYQPRDLHGANGTVLILPLSMLANMTDPTNATVLDSHWRDQMASMVNGEATRRIEEAFPDYMQRNSNADINASTMAYGADPSVWPQDAQDRRMEGDRGWAYVGAVRQTADALETQLTLTDPTADSNWPTKITPIYIPPAP